ncbi:hypothetical protein FK220_011515 [Flavobacteriaceae bacterium TP-CH-4]|uniref:Uncharacterized protein n=1 Tax=Pelagihabitans pacificus TaxID=2696054 RepID=A0A967EE33_9FLAO|nr:hypothetical protein [Pelagihabitans pacificus]NHF59973.1 hypothetical protein [Pelagihabitans pacificus]
MKTIQLRLCCLTMLAILASVASSSAKVHEEQSYGDSQPVISIVETVDKLHRNTPVIVELNSFALPIANTSCYARKRVWVWSGWFPKRVWKWVRVACSQPATRGPGTTIPPH